MGCNFYIKKTNRNGRTPVFVRIRSRKLHTDIKLSTGIETDARRWNSARTSPQAFLHFRATPDGKALFNKLEGIESVIDFRLQEGVSLTGVQARILINKVVFADEFAKREVVQKMTLTWTSTTTSPPTSSSAATPSTPSANASSSSRPSWPSPKPKATMPMPNTRTNASRDLMRMWTPSTSPARNWTGSSPSPPVGSVPACSSPATSS